MESLLSVVLIVAIGFFVLWLLTLLAANHPLVARIFMAASALALLLTSIYFLKQLNAANNPDKFDWVTPLCVQSVLTTFYLMFSIAEYFLEEEYSHTQTDITVHDTYVESHTYDVTDGFVTKTLIQLATCAVVYGILTFIGKKIPLIAGIIIGAIALAYFAYRLILWIINEVKGRNF